jgi:aryl-alcohol dehydrogenase-like predicted oxidoreductase
LKKLRTTYIDILYVHWWDYTTSIEELMHALDTVVKSGKVLYLGASDIPAWIVASANRYARDHGLSQFVIYQGLWNVMLRDFERDIIPMCRHEGMALAPWGAIGRGKFQSKKQIEARKASQEKFRGNSELSEQELKVSEALEKVAGEVGEDVSVTAVALAYCMQKTPYVFPIIGGRKVEHLQDNIKGLEIRLSDKQMEYLESQTTFDPGFPLTFIGNDPTAKGGRATFIGITNSATVEFVAGSQPIPGRAL